MTISMDYRTVDRTSTMFGSLETKSKSFRQTDRRRRELVYQNHALHCFGCERTIKKIQIRKLLFTPQLGTCRFFIFYFFIFYNTATSILCIQSCAYLYSCNCRVFFVRCTRAIQTRLRQVSVSLLCRLSASDWLAPCSL